MDWIDIKKELPINEGDYIICTNSKLVTFAYYNEFYEKWKCNILNEGEIITHWMNLPPAPK